MHIARRRLAILTVLVATLLGACTSPPPTVEEPGDTGFSSAGSASEPTTEVPAPHGQTSTSEIAVGVSSLQGGFNPHVLADSSVMARSVASIVLPSVFRRDSGGTLRLDQAVAEDARVTSREPFTVTYQLRRDASWSDASPIAAEDFSYLAEQMQTQPGVIGAAGYQLIEDVRSRDAGKTVQVQFRKPYPQWRTLFDNLLPAHSLKDLPGGWSEVLRDGISISGGPFAMGSIDRARGQLSLQRNDRYWAQPSSVDRLLLRRLAVDQVPSALREGSIQMAMMRTDKQEYRRLRELADGDAATEVTPVPRPVVPQLELRPGSPLLSDVRLRQAVAAMIDTSGLVAAGTGGGPAAERLPQTLAGAPSQPGTEPTRPSQSPPAPEFAPQRAAGLMRQAGYQRDSEGTWRRAGTPLQLVLGVPAGDAQLAEVAEATAVQLRLAGIAVRVAPVDPRTLYGQVLGRLPAETSGNRAESAGLPDAGAPPSSAVDRPGELPAIDLLVHPRPVLADRAAEMLSSYGCGLEAAGQQGERAPASEQPRGSGPLGWCDPSLQQTMTAALSGEVDTDAALNGVQRQLWGQTVALPLYQPTPVLVTGDSVNGMRVPGLFAGLLDGAAQWSVRR